MDNNIHKQRTEDLRRQAKLWACVVGLLYAVYAVFTSNQRGNAIFVCIISAFTLISVWPDPGTATNDLSSPVRLLARSIREFSWRKFLFAVADLLRLCFRTCDGFVRLLLMLISVGGTAVVMKYGIRNFFLPDFIDIWVKRVGPALAILVVILFPTYMISKRIFLLSMNERDAVCRKYELLFYLTIVLLCLTLLVFFVGLPVEDIMQYMGIKSRRTGGPPAMWRFDPTSLRYIGSMCLIWLFWSIGFGACIVSRFFEVAWRDAPGR